MKRGLRLVSLSCVAGVIALASACGGGGGAGDSPYQATLTWTKYGMPHVSADDWGSVGMAMGYAQSTHTICELYDRVIVASGKQALYKGPGEGDANINADLYYKWLKTKVDAWLEEPATSVQSPSPDARALIAGWVAGVNKYLAEVGGTDGIPDARCRGNPWIQPLDMNDAWMYQATVWETVGSITNSAGIRAAVPPVAVASQACTQATGMAPKSASAATRDVVWMPRQSDVPPGADVVDSDELKQGGVGSNAFGLGKEVTKNGSGMLLSNPHWYWEGSNRFYRAHITIPGKVNVIGASFINTPWILKGHNEHVGWTLTLSTARRAGYWGLTLDPEDPTRYLYEGGYEPMTATCVTAEVKQPDGTVSNITKAFYSSRWGPVLRTNTFPWTTTKAYSSRDAGEGLRSIDQFIAQASARNVEELAAILNKYAAYGTNTTAADSSGRAWYGDVGHVPNVSAAQVSGISGSSPGACLDQDVGVAQWANRYPVLDGSRADCAWQNDPDAVPGLAGLASAPNIFRDDYVTQSNDSYWVTNPNQPLEGFTQLFGPERTARTLRTRMGLKIVENRVAGTDGLGAPLFDLETLESAMFSNEIMSADLGRDALVAQCAAAGYTWNGVDLNLACHTLQNWDRRYNLTSRGAAVWRRFAQNGGLVWAVPFNPDDPVNTPNTLAASDPRVMDALAEAVTDLNAAHIPLDAPFGDVQGVTRQGERIPIHGGHTTDGTFNVIPSVGELIDGVGWIPNTARTGASFIMAVEFGPDGPKSEAVLTYSQSTNPDSPHYADQTKLYSEYGWDRNHFTPEEVTAAAVSSQTLETPRF